jgi:glutamyl-tRNA synthetase
MDKIRTRFAPSPTGFMHVGGVRTALFGWLVARSNNGQFILRLEDTDRAREVEGSDRHIMDSLKWLGLNWDEGPDNGGPYGPYRQSQRLDTYKDWANKLVESGRAYGDPFTPAQVEEFRRQAITNKQPFRYRDHRPEESPSWNDGQALRFKSDPKAYKWHDEVMGELSTGPEVVDDFILIKSDSYPTYNFAHIIDDHLMQISHVIRSQEFLGSIPNYLNLYEALEIKRPLLATLPYVMSLDGQRKLSKRDGAKDILDYAKQGYLPEALINFLASLGWNDGTEQEIFSLDELTQKFKLDRVQRSSARFDEKRLVWMNGAHIRALPIDDLFQLAESYWPEQASSASVEFKKSILTILQDRLKHLSELPALTSFFFEDLPVKPDFINDDKRLASLDKNQLKQYLQLSRDRLAQSDFRRDSLTEQLNQLLVETAQVPAVLFSLIRIATTQAPSSPALVETLAVLGKETVLRRLDQTINSL